jgi:hypothetical protein
VSFRDGRHDPPVAPRSAPNPPCSRARIGRIRATDTVLRTRPARMGSATRWRRPISRRICPATRWIHPPTDRCALLLPSTPEQDVNDPLEFRPLWGIQGTSSQDLFFQEEEGQASSVHNGKKFFEGLPWLPQRSTALPSGNGAVGSLCPLGDESETALASTTEGPPYP